MGGGSKSIPKNLVVGICVSAAVVLASVGYFAVSCIAFSRELYDRITLSNSEIDQIIHDEGVPIKNRILDYKQRYSQYPTSIDQIDMEGFEKSKKWSIQAEIDGDSDLLILIFNINFEEKLLCYIESPSGERGWYFSGEYGFKPIVVSGPD